MLPIIAMTVLIVIIIIIALKNKINKNKYSCSGLPAVKSGSCRVRFA